MFQRSFNDVSRELGGCFKEVSKLFKEYFWSVLRKREDERCFRCFNDISRKFQRSFKGVLSVFQGCS